MNQKDLFNQWNFKCSVIRDLNCIIQNNMNLTEAEARKMIYAFQLKLDFEINELNNLAQEMKQCVWDMAE